MKRTDTEICSSGDCLQGRECPLSHLATRRVLWLDQSEGGRTVETTPESDDHPLWFYVLAAVAVVAVFGSPAFFF